MPPKRPGLPCNRDNVGLNRRLRRRSRAAVCWQIPVVLSEELPVVRFDGRQQLGAGLDPQRRPFIELAHLVHQTFWQGAGEHEQWPCEVWAVGLTQLSEPHKERADFEGRWTPPAVQTWPQVHLHVSPLGVLFVDNALHPDRNGRHAHLNEVAGVVDRFRERRSQDNQLAPSTKWGVLIICICADLLLSASAPTAPLGRVMKTLIASLRAKLIAKVLGFGLRAAEATPTSLSSVPGPAPRVSAPDPRSLSSGCT